MRPASVRTLDASGFEDACASLMRLVQTSYAPELLIGIPTGGLAAAQTMARTAAGRPAIMPLTCRRPATASGSRLPLLRRTLGALPRWRTDLARYADIRWILAGSPSGHLLDQQQTMAIGSAVAAGAATRLLVVDDAVGCSTALVAVLQALRRACPPHTEIRLAAITVMLDDPAIEPDYALYRKVFCRFPWSLDAEQ